MISKYGISIVCEERNSIMEKEGGIFWSVPLSVSSKLLIEYVIVFHRNKSQRYSHMYFDFAGIANTVHYPKGYKEVLINAV